MNLSTITKNILLNIREEIENEENMDIIKKDILKPLIKHIIDELYPYLLKILYGKSQDLQKRGLSVIGIIIN